MRRGFFDYFPSFGGRDQDEENNVVVDYSTEQSPASEQVEAARSDLRPESQEQQQQQGAAAPTLSSSDARALALGGLEASSGSGSTNERADARKQVLSLDKETKEERRDRLAADPKERFDRDALLETTIETIGDAVEFCQLLIDKQLERSQESNPPMNEPIYGDAQCRRAITTLLPDAMIRALFLKTVRSFRNWPRIRPLFGTPPYNFLRPEDAGNVRATGIASGRTNLTYETANETASYSQFGSGHLIDSFLREYRVLPVNEPKESDPLPHDLERTSQSTFLYLHVRVPKRKREEKLALLKDVSKRASVVFPVVGEVLRVRYSSGLKRVWGEKATSDQSINIRVTRMIPRSSNASTAAVLAIKV